MSTDYILLRRPSGHEVSLEEHSSVLDLHYGTDQDDRTIVARNLTDVEAIKIGLGFLKVASYVRGDLRGTLTTDPDAAYVRSILKEMIEG